MITPKTAFIFFIAFVAVLSQNCKKCQNANVPLSDEVMHWFPYTAGQKIVFQRDSLQTDTLSFPDVVDEIILEGDDKCPDDVATRRASAVFLNHPWRRFDISIKRNLFSLSVAYCNLQFNTDTKTKVAGTAWMTFMPADTLNPIDVDVIYLNNLQSPLQEFYYARDIGLMQYIDSLGIIWVRQ